MHVTHAGCCPHAKLSAAASLSTSHVLSLLLTSDMSRMAAASLQTDSFLSQAFVGAVVLAMQLPPASGITSLLLLSPGRKGLRCSADFQDLKQLVSASAMLTADASSAIAALLANIASLLPRGAARWPAVATIAATEFVPLLLLTVTNYCPAVSTTAAMLLQIPHKLVVSCLPPAAAVQLVSVIAQGEDISLQPFETLVVVGFQT